MANTKGKYPAGCNLKRDTKRSRMSSTPGISKPNCIATPLMKSVARRGRSCKWREYASILDRWNRRLGSFVK